MLQGAKAIGELLKKNSTLRTLELNNNLIDYSGFSGLAKALLENKSLQSLYLHRNYGGALGASALAKGLEGNEALRDELFKLKEILLRLQNQFTRARITIQPANVLFITSTIAVVRTVVSINLESCSEKR
ncbi:hypothetical protein L2E82_28549 [Cichorium intybus]|uniref:Uncharacterized protein n=1 Tax=Cichorium intybus TaxID=13427 RepID=A0ACB9CWB9_CICIN|nr:hypothetical protein L2E82_28549 [Cichorium intybus]